jgi:hypothetical protein
MLKMKKRKINPNLNDLVSAHLAKIGGVKTGDTIRVQTICGELAVTPMDAWVACRFANPERATAFLNPQMLSSNRLSPTTGKWNFYFFAGADPGDSFAHFVSELDKIVPAYVITRDGNVHAAAGAPPAESLKAKHAPSKETLIVPGAEIEIAYLGGSKRGWRPIKVQSVEGKGPDRKVFAVCLIDNVIKQFTWDLITAVK